MDNTPHRSVLPKITRVELALFVAPPKKNFPRALLCGGPPHCLCVHGQRLQGPWEQRLPLPLPLGPGPTCRSLPGLGPRWAGSISEQSRTALRCPAEPGLQKVVQGVSLKVSLNAPSPALQPALQSDLPVDWPAADSLSFSHILPFCHTLNKCPLFQKETHRQPRAL